MDNIAGLLSLFLIGAAFLSSCGEPQTPKGEFSAQAVMLAN